MRLTRLGALFFLLAAGSASAGSTPLTGTPGSSVGRDGTAVAPVAASPPAESIEKPAIRREPPASKTPAAKTPAVNTPAAKTPAPAAKAEAPAKAAPPAALDLALLEKRLKDTSAIGVFTKLTLKNQVDDLLNQFKDFYEGRRNTTLDSLREPYDLLILKVLTLLQDDDPSLAREIRESREAIWGILSDPVKFSKL